MIPPAGQRRLLAWSDETRRDLPWRRTREPWAVLVSELMLQQTQVARVIPKYEAFLTAYPTPAACAAASVGEIVTAWAGLGYNRRAVNLHRCATVVITELDGRLPDDLAGLLALPGVGPYTARAVLAFAHERDVGVLDTNAARVLARTAGDALSRADAQRSADEAVPAGEGWRWNQAMLDLGATVCAARSADCDRCPLAAWCSWSLAGRPEPDPAIGSAGVSTPQSRFEGSHRQGRGRLVASLRQQGTVDEGELAAAAGWPDDAVRARSAADSLVVDGIARWADGALTWS